MCKAFRYFALVLSFALMTPAIASASFLLPQKPLPPGQIPQFVEPLPTHDLSLDAALGLVPPKSQFVPYRFAADNAAGQTRTITMVETQTKILPDAFYALLPPPLPGTSYLVNPQLGTMVWKYKDFSLPEYDNVSYLGPTVLAPRGWRDNVVYLNGLVNPVLQYWISVDKSLAWADPLDQQCQLLFLGIPPVGACALPYVGPVPTAVHFHGTESPSAYDGGPDEWFTANVPGPLPIVGPAYVTNNYVYENQQEPGSFFYHDHGLGITRLNVYSGMAGGYLILDNNTNVAGAPLGTIPGAAATLPALLNPAVTLPPFPTRWMPLVIQDRMFDKNGQLLFPDIGINPEHPFWVPEFFGDVIVVNGKSWPYLNVQADRYRFSIVNGSNARFYRLFFPAPTRLKPQPPMWVIGTEQGYLNAPVPVTSIVIAPGERYDVVVDFTGFAAGSSFILQNDAPVPFPAGLPVVKKFQGQIIKFNVVGAVAAGSTPMGSVSALGGIRTSIVRDTKNLLPTVTRRLTLNEVLGLGGPLEMLLNNTKYVTQGTGSVTNPITELPQVGSTEIWEILNMTVDTHPMHLHLVSFQLIDRQAINLAAYDVIYNGAFPGVPGNPVCTAGVYCPGYGPPFSYALPGGGIVGGNPDWTALRLPGTLQTVANGLIPAWESGWKDTVKMNPGEVTRIMVQFTNQEGGPYSFDVTSEPGYVWHCHIVDHEDNEMMRPFKVVP